MTASNTMVQILFFKHFLSKLFEASFKELVEGTKSAI